MKKVSIILVIAALLFSVCFAESTEYNPGWTLPETIEMTEEAAGIFDGAVAKLLGVGYEPLGLLGEKDGLYCFLCRATVIYPGATPYYALLYATADGVQNVWPIWMDAHANP